MELGSPEFHGSPCLRQQKEFQILFQLPFTSSMPPSLVKEGKAEGANIFSMNDLRKTMCFTCYIHNFI